MGMLTDRFGARAVFTALMFFVAVPVALVPAAPGYRNLLIVALFLGIVGSSFAVRVGYVSRWFSIRARAVRWVLMVWEISANRLRFPWPRRCGRVRIPCGVLGDVGSPAGLGMRICHFCEKRYPDGSAQGPVGDARRAFTGRWRLSIF
jgi:hypothetical protein